MICSYKTLQVANQVKIQLSKRITSACCCLLLLLTIQTTSAPAVDLIGYLPYYRMNASYNSNTLPGQLAMLDEIRYFGLTAASNGTIATLDGATVASHTSRIDTIKNGIAALPADDRPRLNITLGGAGEASSFATIAASSSLRTTFAQSIKSLLDQTGATSVDIDWEHPTAGIQRITHYPAMLASIKQEVGANRRVYATVDPTVIIPNSVFSGANAIDGVSLMTYDLGWWGNDPANPFQGEHSLPEYVEDSVEAWSEPPGSPNDRNWVFGTWGNNVPTSKFGVGLPFYAHTVTSPDATYTYSQLAAGGTTTDGNYYMYQGRSAWIPGPSLAEQRVQFAHDRGLQHIIFWELGHDLAPSNANSLLRRAFEKNQSLMPVPGDYTGDRLVNADDYAAWRNSLGQTGASLAADGNRNQVVDAADYVIWRKHLSGPGSDASAIMTVPEPNCLSWFLLATIFAATHRALRWNRRNA
jgi:Glycosyl hydrolases family 18